MSQFLRQSFLGADSEQRLASATIGLVGLGGGGSHLGQQFGHIGVGGLVVVDPDHVELSNLNRLVGATHDDARRQVKKVEVARRVILGANPAARVSCWPTRWQDATEALARCDVIIGGVDSYLERDQLEAFCRRLMIPYIDMGMDVHEIGNAFSISGQTILSMPGQPCLRCLGVITDALLTREAKKYGAAGGKPQVVWPNAILASVAVSLTMKLLTPWFSGHSDSAYIELNGNADTLGPSNRLKAVAGHPCRHYPLAEAGDPLFDIREPVSTVTDVRRPAWFVRLWKALVTAVTP